MKLLRMRLANWLTKGGYLAACKAATHWEEQHKLMQDKVVRLERDFKTAVGDYKDGERALREKDDEIKTLKQKVEGIRTTLNVAIEASSAMAVTPTIIANAIRDARAMTKGKAA